MQNQEKGRRKFMAKMGLGTLALGMGNVGAYAFAPKNEITKKFNFWRMSLSLGIQNSQRMTAKLG